MERVYFYKDSNGEYRVDPAVLVITGGQTVRFFNCTGVNLFVTVPKGASKPSEPVEIEVASEDRGDIKARKHNDNSNRAYSYKVETSSGKRAKGNSDPVLIIEN